MTPTQFSLLRRTAVAVAAVTGFFISTGSQAATVSLSSGASCTYSAMSVQPDGSFVVTCLASGGGTGPGAFSLSQPGDVPSGTPVTVSAFRTGGTTGAVAVQYNVSGAGCTTAGGTLSWADADSSAKTIGVSTLVSGSCTVALSGPTGGATMGAPTSVSFNVTSGGGTPPPVGACPTGFTPPANLLTMTMGGLGNPLLAMAKSDQVVSIPLPGVQPGYSTGQVAFSESAGGAYTPQPVTLNISISQCQGLIDTDYTNRCNLVSTNGNYNSITWFAQAYSIIKDAASANLRGYCWAPSSSGQWYINAKWTYSQCAFGAQTCGFAIQQNYGPY